MVCSERRNWFVRARLRLFMLMFRNSVRAVDLFNLPPQSYVEVGRQIERSSKIGQRIAYVAEFCRVSAWAYRRENWHAS